MAGVQTVAAGANSKNFQVGYEKRRLPPIGVTIDDVDSVIYSAESTFFGRYCHGDALGDMSNSALPFKP